MGYVIVGALLILGISLLEQAIKFEAARIYDSNNPDWFKVFTKRLGDILLRDIFIVMCCVLAIYTPATTDTIIKTWIGLLLNALGYFGLIAFTAYKMYSIYSIAMTVHNDKNLLPKNEIKEVSTDVGQQS